MLFSNRSRRLQRTFSSVHRASSSQTTAWLFEGFDGDLLCSTEFYVLAPLGDADIAFLVPFLLSGPVQKAFSSAEEGGHHPRMPPDVLLKLTVPLCIMGQHDDVSRRVRQSVQLIRAGEKVMLGLHTDIAKLTAQFAANDDGKPVAVNEHSSSSSGN